MFLKQNFGATFVLQTCFLIKSLKLAIFTRISPAKLLRMLILRIKSSLKQRINLGKKEERIFQNNYDTPGSDV